MSTAVLVAILLAHSLLFATAAFANTRYVLGRQYAVTLSGVGGHIWAYNWLVPLQQGANHVSSLYVLKYPYTPASTPYNYIEAGLCKDNFTQLNGDSRPVVFVAYEDAPWTAGQVKTEYGRAAIGQWHSVGIANFQPYPGAGPTNWCVYWNGSRITSRSKPSFYQGQPLSASERGVVGDNNLSSFSSLYSRRPDNTTGPWTSIRFEDYDYGYHALLVAGDAWRCIAGE